MSNANPEIYFSVVDDRCRKHPDHNIHLPARSTKGACAYDFYAPADMTIAPSCTETIWTDVKVHLPRDMMLMINVRSSMGKKLIALANSSGWVDSDYYGNPGNDGNIGIMLHNYGEEPYVIKEGDRISQGMIVTYYTMVEAAFLDDDSETRKGGFGSTGV